MRKSHGNHTEITQKSHGTHSEITRKSLGNHSEITRKSLRNHSEITQKSRGNHLEITPKSRGNHEEMRWKSLGKILNIFDDFATLCKEGEMKVVRKDQLTFLIITKVAQQKRSPSPLLQPTTPTPLSILQGGPIKLV